LFPSTEELQQGLVIWLVGADLDGVQTERVEKPASAAVLLAA
jgi:hypothetical protein